jgi:hypothetical protein
MRASKRAIAIPKRGVKRQLGNPKLPSGAIGARAWDERNSQLADLDMERLRNSGIPADQEQFVKKGAKTYRNNKRQAYKW